jgi:hypothetical protein
MPWCLPVRRCSVLLLRAAPAALRALPTQQTPAPASSRAACRSSRRSSQRRTCRRGCGARRSASWRPPARSCLGPCTSSPHASSRSPRWAGTPCAHGVARRRDWELSSSDGPRYCSHKQRGREAAAAAAPHRPGALLDRAPALSSPFQLRSRLPRAAVQVGSIFEYADRNPIFGVVQPDSPLWAPILGLFALTGLPMAGEQGLDPPGRQRPVGLAARSDLCCGQT